MTASNIIRKILLQASRSTIQRALRTLSMNLRRKFKFIQEKQQRMVSYLRQVSCPSDRVQKSHFNRTALFLRVLIWQKTRGYGEIVDRQMEVELWCGA